VIGVRAAVVQFLGLARWRFLVPELARAYADPASSQATRDATAVAFESFHRYLGIRIGECLGYLLTGAYGGCATRADSPCFIGFAGRVLSAYLVAPDLNPAAMVCRSAVSQSARHTVRPNGHRHVLCPYSSTPFL
jgi:hypothetical protein